MSDVVPSELATPAPTAVGSGSADDVPPSGGLTPDGSGDQCGVSGGDADRSPSPPLHCSTHGSEIYTLTADHSGSSAADSEGGDTSSSPPQAVGAASGCQQYVRQLEQRLQDAERKIRLREGEVVKLTQVRVDIEAELQELTASLFQEAHKMVLAANEKQASAEKSLLEANMKIDVLQAEVSALKALVITSTPSRPNSRLFPQIEHQLKSNSLFKRGHRRTTSSVETVGTVGQAESSPCLLSLGSCRPEESSCCSGGSSCSPDILVESAVAAELRAWRQSPTLSRRHAFIARLHRHDIGPCLQFVSDSVSARLLGAIDDNAVFIEVLSTSGPDCPATPPPPPPSDTCDGAFSQTPPPQTPPPQASVGGERVRDGEEKSSEWSLLGVDAPCTHRIRLPGDDHWIPISQLCRNRIIAVCECVNYLRYIQLGLVKASDVDVYSRIAHLRRNICLARLGFPV